MTGCGECARWAPSVVLCEFCLPARSPLRRSWASDAKCKFCLPVHNSVERLPPGRVTCAVRIFCLFLPCLPSTPLLLDTVSSFWQACLPLSPFLSLFYAFAVGCCARLLPHCLSSCPLLLSFPVSLLRLCLLLDAAPILASVSHSNSIPCLPPFLFLAFALLVEAQVFLLVSLRPCVAVECCAPPSRSLPPVVYCLALFTPPSFSDVSLLVFHASAPLLVYSSSLPWSGMLGPPFHSLLPFCPPCCPYSCLHSFR